MDSEELSLWLAQEAIEPQGQQRADLQTAQILAQIANLFRGENDKPLYPHDLVPDFWKERTKHRKKNRLSEDLEAVRKWSQQAGKDTSKRGGKGRERKTLR